MEKFSECFREPVRQRFGQDGIVVVMIGGEYFRQFVRADSRRHGKSAEVIDRTSGAMKSARQ